MVKFLDGEDHRKLELAPTRSIENGIKAALTGGEHSAILLTLLFRQLDE